MRKWGKKGFLSIELILVATLVITFGIIIVGYRATQTDSVLDVYEESINKEIERTN